jgi:hypothetical protein
MLCLSYYVYVFSSTKSVTRVERDLPETEKGMGDGWGRVVGWRNDPNNVCTCEKMNKKNYSVLISGYRNAEMDTYLLPTLNLTELPYIVGMLKLCVYGVLQTLYAKEALRNRRHAACYRYRFFFIVPLGFSYRTQDQRLNY